VFRGEVLLLKVGRDQDGIWLQVGAKSEPTKLERKIVRLEQVFLSKD
jgi:hypothetical protein